MKLILLDRDGVINVNYPQSVLHPNDMQLLPGSGSAIRLLNERGYKTCVVTNQSAVGRGQLTPDDLAVIHDCLLDHLAAEGAFVDHLIYCPDTAVAPNYRRKPGPGMLLEAMALFDAAPEETIMIGDHIRDLEAAFIVGVHRVLVLTGHGSNMQLDPVLETLAPIQIYNDLLAATQAILQGSFEEAPPSSA